MIKMLMCVVLCCVGCKSSTGEPKHLFNGQNLDGWSKHGGDATYVAEDGAIVGRRGPGPNTFLCTTKKYGDFELELDFRWDDTCNSGIQIRSRLNTVTDRVTGYQCELDPSDRSWTCGLFYEGPRGWLDPLDDNDEARAARKLDDWNHIRIVAEGDHIRTWLNGVPCADFTDPGGERTGVIGLQVHGGAKGQVRWKNIRLTER